MSEETRLRRIVQIIALCLLVQLGISWKLWFPLHRDVPLIPTFAWLPVHWSMVGNGLLITLCTAALIALIFRPFWRWGWTGFLLPMALLVLEDISRFQPWIYLFGIIGIAVIIYPNKGGRRNVFLTLALLWITLYFWSGFWKLNHAFSVEFFPWLMDVFGLGTWANAHPHAAWAAASVEMLAGLGLAFPFTRKAALWVLSLTHVFLLVSIGPFGHQWNAVIWPWNVAMILLLWLTFGSGSLLAGSSVGESVRHIRSNAFLLTVFVLGGIMPALFVFDLWDSHLSGSLYSGNNRECIFFYPESERQHLPASAVPFAFYTSHDSEEFLVIDHWVMEELSAPFYPETRYFKAMGRCLCEQMNEWEGTGISMTVKARFTSAQHLETYSCAELLE